MGNKLVGRCIKTTKFRERLNEIKQELERLGMGHVWRNGKENDIKAFKELKKRVWIQKTETNM